MSTHSTEYCTRHLEIIAKTQVHRNTTITIFNLRLSVVLQELEGCTDVENTQIITKHHLSHWFNFSPHLHGLSLHLELLNRTQNGMVCDSSPFSFLCLSLGGKWMSNSLAGWSAVGRRKNSSEKGTSDLQTEQII